MDDFHCDTFQLRMQFEAGEMNTEAFLKALAERGIAKEQANDGGRDLEVIFGSTDEATDENAFHAHANVRIWGDNSGRVELTYHSGRTESGIEPPPNVIDAPKWLGDFFPAALTTHVHVNYTFDESFEPTIGLNFPLVTSQKQLAGAVVSGLAFVLPTEPQTTIIIQGGVTEETFIFLRKTINLKLKDFVLEAELQNLSEAINALVKRAKQ